MTQAPPPERKTARRKGVITKPKNGKAPKDKEERDPQLPTSEPMPSHVEDITDAGMRAMWEQSMAMDGEAAPYMEALEPLDYRCAAAAEACELVRSGVRRANSKL